MPLLAIFAADLEQVRAKINDPYQNSISYEGCQQISLHVCMLYDLVSDYS